MKFKLFLMVLSLSLFVTGCSFTPVETVEEEVVKGPTYRSVETELTVINSIQNDLKYSGRVVASKQLGVVSTTVGKVTQYFVDVGDIVEEGDILFQLDTSDLQDNMLSLQANYDVTKLAYTNAETNYNNSKILYAEGVISQSDFEQSTYSYDAARANLRSVEVQIETLQNSIEKTVILSPISGTITDRSIEKGGYASSSSPAYTIMNFSPVKIEVGVSEQLINRIEVGQEAEVLVRAVSDKAYQGVVTAISPIMDATSMYTVSLEVPNEDYLIKSGMLSEVTFILESAEDALVIPVNAIIPSDDGSYVYIVKQGNPEEYYVEKVFVETGILTGNYVEIVSGLSAGENLVIKGQTYLSDGERVQVNTPIITMPTFDDFAGIVEGFFDEEGNLVFVETEEDGGYEADEIEESMEESIEEEPQESTEAEVPLNTVIINPDLLQYPVIPDSVVPSFNTTPSTTTTLPETPSTTTTTTTPSIQEENHVVEEAPEESTEESQDETPVEEEWLVTEEAWTEDVWIGDIWLDEAPIIPEVVIPEINIPEINIPVAPQIEEDWLVTEDAWIEESWENDWIVTEDAWVEDVWVEPVTPEIPLEPLAPVAPETPSTEENWWVEDAWVDTTPSVQWIDE